MSFRAGPSSATTPTPVGSRVALEGDIELGSVETGLEDMRLGRGVTPETGSVAPRVVGLEVTSDGRDLARASEMTRETKRAENKTENAFANRVPAYRSNRPINLFRTISYFCQPRPLTDKTFL